METLPQTSPQSYKRRLSIRDLSDNKAVSGRVESQNGSPHVAIKISRKRRAQAEPDADVLFMSIKPPSTVSPISESDPESDERRSSIDSKRQRISIDEVLSSSASTSPSQVKVLGRDFDVGSDLPIHSGTLAALMEQEIDVVFDTPSPSSSTSLESELVSTSTFSPSSNTQEGEDESEFLAFLETLQVSTASSSTPPPVTVSSTTPSSSAKGTIIATDTLRRTDLPMRGRQSQPKG